MAAPSRGSAQVLTAGAQPDGGPDVLGVRLARAKMLAELAKHLRLALRVLNREEDGRGNPFSREAGLRAHETGDLEAPLGFRTLGVEVGEILLRWPPFETMVDERLLGDR